MLGSTSDYTTVIAVTALIASLAAFGVSMTRGHEVSTTSSQSTAESSLG